jgi:hypothetical protein
LPIQILEQAVDGHLQNGVDGFGGDFGEGLEDESAFVHQGVGDDQFLAADDFVAVEKQVDIDEAGFPFFAADAAELMLDLENAMEQGVRAEGGFDLCGGIEEMGRFGWAADGGVFEKRGDACHSDAVGIAEAFKGGADIFLSVAEVGAQSEICRDTGGASH